jgi:hypothetical protein
MMRLGQRASLLGALAAYATANTHGRQLPRVANSSRRSSRDQSAVHRDAGRNWRRRSG